MTQCPTDQASEAAHEHNCKRFEVWKKAMELAREVHVATKTFPSEERFGLTSQMRRCAVSIPSNLAEGWGRGTDAERRQFARLSRGSACELETQVLLAQEFGYLSSDSAGTLQGLLDEVLALLGGILRRD